MAAERTYIDLTNESEDERIVIIGTHAGSGLIIGFEYDEKADRYVLRLYKVRIINRKPFES